jgi:hypothetical protein
MLMAGHWLRLRRP